jgi:cytidine deaminase
MNPIEVEPNYPLFTMEQLEIVAKIKIYSYTELTEAQKSVIDAAREATLRSYSPYSHYAVGAAALLDNGEIVSGCNQENAAYPSGLCAERTTLFYAGSRYPEAKVLKLAIIARTQGEVTQELCTPCGACRQVILETEERGGIPIEILMCNRDQVFAAEGIHALLPLSFGIDTLKLSTISSK